MATVSLNFMPAFCSKHLGLVYGEAYYFEPEYRAEVDCAEQRFLYETLGGVGPRTNLRLHQAVLVSCSRPRSGAEARLGCTSERTLWDWRVVWCARGGAADHQKRQGRG